MDKLKKVGLTALSTALVTSSAVAADLAVGGGAKLVLTGGDNDTQGNGWTMLDSITFRASADLDNGWTVSTSQNIAGGAANNANTKINMGEMGTLEFHKSGGTSAVAAWDDKLPAANEESWHSLTGAAGGASPIMSGGSGADMFKYSVNVMDGLDVYGSYMPSDGATSVESSTAYGVQYSGIDGLTVGFAQGDNNNKVAVTNGNSTDSAAGAEIENTAMFITYALDSFTIGVQDNESDSATADADTEYRGYGISYAVTEDLSVSYAQGTIDFEASGSEDQETSAVGLSYTSGGITLSASFHDGENLGGSTATTADTSAYEINIAFAF